jgi:cytochrome P450
MQSHFDRPDEFDPSRWEAVEADGSITTVKPPEGHYIPFGFGSRTCIGFRFAEVGFPT